MPLKPFDGIPPHKEWSKVVRPGRGAQAEGYLMQAAESLRSAGDPRFLWYSDVPQRYAKDQIFGPVQQALDAANRRLRALRGAVIFAALAAEAYANDFLEDALPRVEADALDRLTTLEKLVIGPKVAGLGAPLDRGTEPIQTIKRLFEVRNGLVHPRKSGYSPFVQYVTEKDEKDLGPPACVRYIRRVAEVITTLDHLCDPPHVIGLSINLSSQPTVFDELIAQIGDKIGSPVSREAQSPLDLGEAAERRAMKRARTHHAASGQSSS